MSERITLALLALSRARQVDFPEEDQRVYCRVIGLKKLTEQEVVTACAELATEPRKEFEPAMPTAGDIIKRAERVGYQRWLREKNAAPKMLAIEGPNPNPPVSREKWANFREAVAKNLREKHTMNGGGNG